jgi:hypothetical protein
MKQTLGPVPSTTTLETILNPKIVGQADDAYDRGIGYLHYLMEGASFEEINLQAPWWITAKHRLLCSAVMHRLFTDEFLLSEQGALVAYYAMALERKLMAS